MTTITTLRDPVDLSLCCDLHRLENLSITYNAAVIADILFAAVPATNSPWHNSPSASGHEGIYKFALPISSSVYIGTPPRVGTLLFPVDATLIASPGGVVSSPYVPPTLQRLSVSETGLRDIWVSGYPPVTGLDGVSLGPSTDTTLTEASQKGGTVESIDTTVEMPQALQHESIDTTVEMPQALQNESIDTTVEMPQALQNESIDTTVEMPQMNDTV